MRVLFFGTPGFAVPSLDALAAIHDIAGVVTQPDRPRGRGHKLAIGPVKQRALEQGFAIFQPDRLSTEESIDWMRRAGADLGVVAAYGKILPQRLLDLPRRGMINVHASLLPRWRGAAPVHRAVLSGDAETGITIMRVVKALDAGPMLARAATPIDPEETSAELEARLAELGAALLVQTVDRLAGGALDEAVQDEALVTYAARLERRDSQVDWARPARAVHDQIRGLHPWPLAAAMLGERRVLLLESRIAGTMGTGEPGTVIEVEPDGLVVVTRPGAIRLTRLQAEGRAPVPVRAFLNGHRVVPGDRFTPLRLNDDP